MASLVAHCSSQNLMTFVETGTSDLIISKLEDYLIKVFGYPKSFLMVLAKASFGRQPIPIVNHELFLQITWKLLKQVEDSLNIQNPISKEVTVCTGNSSCYQHKVTQTDDIEAENSLIQITASSQEINRRVESFMQRKRQEVDAYNKREFCVLRDDKQESTCARTDAAYVPRHGKKSLLKTYRVYNKAESTREMSRRKRIDRLKDLDYVWEPNHPANSLEIKHIPPETYERIDVIEKHVIPKPVKEDQKGKTDSSYPVLKRIKMLENRILFLEGLSPEYFNHDLKDRPSPLQSSDGNKNRFGDAVSVDKRINELRDILQSRYGPKT